MIINKILFIGISPGFAGSRAKSKSVQRVKDWMSNCDYEESEYDWLNLVDVPGQNPKMSEVELKQSDILDYNKIICLGNKPGLWCETHQIEHIKVPHPSGLNRKWNIPGQELETIQIIRNFLAK